MTKLRNLFNIDNNTPIYFLVCFALAVYIQQYAYELNYTIFSKPWFKYGLPPGLIIASLATGIISLFRSSEGSVAKGFMAGVIVGLIVLSKNLAIDNRMAFSEMPRSEIILGFLLLANSIAAGMYTTDLFRGMFGCLIVNLLNWSINKLWFLLFLPK